MSVDFYILYIVAFQLLFIASQKELNPDEVCQRLNFCPPSAAFKSLKLNNDTSQRNETYGETPGETHGETHEEITGETLGEMHEEIPLRVIHLADIHLDPLYVEVTEGRMRKPNFEHSQA